jgi:3-oxoacid CoA-transferase B subunit
MCAIGAVPDEVKGELARAYVVLRSGATTSEELRDGQIINLGIGLPTLIADHVPAGVDVIIQTENGAIGVGPRPEPGCEDRDRANAGNQPITLIGGGSYFDSATSFGMIRGGHLDATFLGTLQVDEEGNIANWTVPGKMLAGMGGAMDLITGARVVHIVTEHCSKDGASKLMKKCSFPLTGARECDVVITERALFRRHPERGFVLEEVACGYTLEDIAACTDMAYVVADDVKLDAYGGDL